MAFDYRQWTPGTPLPDEMTYGECIGPAMEMTDQAEADAWFEALVQRMMRVMPCNRAEAERIERSNLGYFAGYCSEETMARVNRLFHTDKQEPTDAR